MIFKNFLTIKIGLICVGMVLGGCMQPPAESEEKTANNCSKNEPYFQIDCSAQIGGFK